MCQPAFSERDFRNALGQFATGVTVVTTSDAHGHPIGMTVSSFNSVSLNPALVLWSLARNAGCYAAFAQAQYYAIHVLAAHHKDLALQFSQRGIDRFADLAWSAGAGGAPLLDGAAAVLECRNRSRHEEGDHVILVGEVEQCRYRGEAAPLIFHGGRFHTALPSSGG